MIEYLKSVLNYRDSKKQLLYIILIAFLITFAVARFYSLFVGYSIYVRGYHIHHFYFGMAVLSFGGVLGILSSNRKYLQIAAGMIGIGLGLFADEIGLLLNCTSSNRACVYAFPDTFDIIGWIGVIIVLLIVITDMLERRKSKM